MGQYGQMFDLKITVGHSDLYFMIKCFYLIFWKLFDVWIWLLGKGTQYDQTFDLKTIGDHSDYIYSSVMTYFNTVFMDVPYTSINSLGKHFE